MHLAYSYLRFSSDKQMDGNSIERQTEAAAAWCKRNGVALDRVTTFRDLATPAFTGEHRKNPDRNALALFLQMALGDERGEGRIIPSGSYLIIESLDRLTREHVQPALGLIISLLQAGIRIVQLNPAEMVYDSKSDMLPLMLMIAELSRGHNESLMKSIRVSAAWQKKKQLARENGVIMSPRCPPWLRIAGGKYHVIKSAAEIYRRIFQLSIDGLGVRSIAARLNAKRVIRPDGRGLWTSTYVAFCLRDRRFLGEHQPLKKQGTKIVKDGEPIPNYYPAIIAEETWRLSREISHKRKQIKGRHASEAYVNIFKGLLHNAIDGGSFRLQRRKMESGGRILDYRALVNTKGFEGTEKMSSFRLDVFEYAILSQLSEIKPGDLQPQKQDADELEALLAEEKRLKARKEKIIAAMTDSEEDVGSLAQADKRLSEKLRELAVSIAEARRKKHNAPAIEWKDCAELAAYVLAHPQDAETRRRLRSQLYRRIEGIWLVFCGLPGSIVRFGAAQVFFKDSPLVRTYFVWFRHAHYHGKTGVLTPAAYYVASPLQEEPRTLKDKAYACRLMNDAMSQEGGIPPPRWQEWPPPPHKGERGKRK